MKRLRAMGRIVMGILRELADETAYRRHLAHHQCGHSGHEWRHFCEQRLRAKYSNVKCC